MGARRSAFTTADTTLVTTTETVILTISSVDTQRAGQKVQLSGTAQITTGGSTTGLTFRWRRGTAITDTLIGDANTVQVSAAAGSTEEHSHKAEDTPGDVAGQSYVLTVQQVAAAANGACLQAAGWADIGF